MFLNEKSSNIHGPYPLVRHIQTPNGAPWKKQSTFLITWAITRVAHSTLRQRIILHLASAPQNNIFPAIK